jgi:hypothetical protein
MTIKSINYQELLPSGSFLNVRYGMEISIDSDSEVERAYELASQLVKETHKKQFPQFYRDGMPLYQGEDGIPSIPHKSPLDQFQEDFEFNELKKTLATIEFQEDALQYLDTTQFRYAIAAKELVNSKPSKNK